MLVMVKKYSFSNLRKLLSTISLLLLSFISNAQNSIDQTQTFQIYTHFQSVIGRPTWLLIIRDVETGLVSPYIFDIRNNDNFWLALTYGHHYKVTNSSLKFGKFAVIHNFCHLENGILSYKSMFITLRGVISPDPESSNCYVRQYKDTYFTIVNNTLI